MTSTPVIVWTYVDQNAGWVPIDGNRYVPHACEASVVLWPDVEVQIGVFVDDARVCHCRRLEIRCEPGTAGSISTTRLRQLPLAQLMQQITDAAVHDRVDHADGSVTYRPAGVGGNEPMRLSKRRNVDAALLRRVADVYRAAVGDRPTTAVAEHFGVSHSTAARYVSAARTHKLLGRTRPGQKGTGEQR